MQTRTTRRFVWESLEGALVLGASILTWPLSRYGLRNWGSTGAERDGTWAGDDLIAGSTRKVTRAITIDARPRAVWERVVQLGLGRAGFYSYELFERLGGIAVKNVESVEAAWQSLAVGDEVLLHPKAGVRVSKLARGAYVCFGARTVNGGDSHNPADPSWSIYIEPEAAGCRLVVRSCLPQVSRRSPWRHLVGGLEAALDFVMEQRMLRTIKRLCESRAPRSASSAAC